MAIGATGWVLILKLPFSFSGWFTIINEKSKTVEERDTVKLNGANKEQTELQRRANQNIEQIKKVKRSMGQKNQTFTSDTLC